MCRETTFMIAKLNFFIAGTGIKAPPNPPVTGRSLAPFCFPSQTLMYLSITTQHYWIESSLATWLVYNTHFVFLVPPVEYINILFCMSGIIPLQCFMETQVTQARSLITQL